MKRAGRAKFVSPLKSVPKEEPSYLVRFHGNLFVWNTVFHMTSLNFKNNQTLAPAMWSTARCQRWRFVCVWPAIPRVQPRCLRLYPRLELLASCHPTDRPGTGCKHGAGSQRQRWPYSPPWQEWWVCRPSAVCFTWLIVTRAAERVVSLVFTGYCTQWRNWTGFWWEPVVLDKLET